MSQLTVSSLRDASLLYLYTEKDTIDLDPEYQRLGDIWTLGKRQLLIDSLINGYDIPKIYFHQHAKPKKVHGEFIRYAIVDGKQRMQAIWDFMDDKFALSDDFEYLRDPEENDIELGGLKYSDIGKKYPRIKARFDGTSLDIVTIQTDDLELIEDMFSRLNEAVPLNAAEQRNAWPGVIPRAVRDVCQHNFFVSRLPFPNRRYRHYDLATKFIYLQSSNHIVDLKKSYLDAFVRRSKNMSVTKSNTLVSEVNGILDCLDGIFEDADRLLRSVGMVTLYFLLARKGMDENWADDLDRQVLFKFEDARQENREVASDEIADANYEFLEFDRLAQSPNDAVALEFRFKVLEEFIDSEWDASS